MKRGISKKGSFLKFENQTVNLDMERMEVKKCHHYEKEIEYSRSVLLMSVMKTILKISIEKIRKI
jgi:hypothetical protein